MSKHETDDDKSRVVFVFKRPKFWIIILVLLAVSLKIRIHDYRCHDCDSTWREAELRLVVWPLFVVWHTTPVTDAGKAAPVTDHPSHTLDVLGFRDYGLSSLWG